MKVTVFQKEVKRVIQLTDEDYNSVDDDDIVGDAYPADESCIAFLESQSSRQIQEIITNICCRTASSL